MAKKRAFDKSLFVSMIGLLVLGLIMVYSARPPEELGGSSRQFYKQLIAAILGLGAMAAAMHIDYRSWRRPWLIYGALGLVLSLLVAVLSAPAINGSSRWLRIGGLSFQPSELAKLVLIVFLAYQIEKKWDRINEWRTLFPCGLAIALVALLVLAEPDFGSAGLILLICGWMLFLGGLAWRWVVLAVASVPAVLWLMVLRVPYRRDRLFTFLDPESEPYGGGFQVIQSLIAIGSGGVWGQGLGDSAQKMNFLPLANSDFIFSIVGEELGLVGATAVLVGFAFFAWRGLRTGVSAPDVFGRFLAWGITLAISAQVLINVSVTLGLLPVTGTPLPFVSLGGSSLIVTLAACGLLLNISEHAK